MVTETAIDQVRCELHRALDRMQGDLYRIEILSAALGVFARPVPDYEPVFRHLAQEQLTEHEIGNGDS